LPGERLSNVELKVLVHSVFIGITVGFAIVIYLKLTHFFMHIFFFGDPFKTIKKIPFYILIFPPIVGAIIVSFLKITNENIKEYGVVRVARILEEGKLIIGIKDVILKIFASAISIGSGFAVGNEGPSAEVGAILAFYLSKLVKIPVTLMRTVIAAGASAGIAAVFISPFTGFVFGLELIVKELSLTNSFIMVLSAVFGFAIASHFFHGDIFPFIFQRTISFQDILYSVFMVPLVVIASLIFLRVKDSINLQIFYPIEKKVEKIMKKYGISGKYKIFVRAILAGFFTACLLKLTPYAGFSGHILIEKLIYENQEFAFRLALLILLARILSTSLALGWGAVGGLFMPILSIGALLGYLYALVLKDFLPDIYLPNSYFAAIGAAAFLGSILNVPTTAIVLSFELTLNFSVIVPAAVVTIFSMHFLLFYRELYSKYLEKKYKNRYKND